MTLHQFLIPTLVKTWSGFYAGQAPHFDKYFFNETHNTKNALDGQSHFTSAIEKWDDYTVFNISQTTGVADVYIYNADLISSKGIVGYFEDSNIQVDAEAPIAGTTYTRAEIAIDDAYPITATGYNYWLALHEFGHALGLRDVDGIASGYNTDMTVMSENIAGGGNRYAVTPMLYDIMAVQSMYGANRSNTTSTTYSYDSLSTDTTFNGAALSRTIWDGGGSDDELDLSAYTDGGLFLDLRAGFDENGLQYASYIGNSVVFMANHADIENVTGTAHDDTIYGNSPTAAETTGATTYTAFHGANILRGGAGADNIYGNGGDNSRMNCY